MTGSIPVGTEIIFAGNHPQAGNAGRIIEWVNNETFGLIPRIQITSGSDTGSYCFATAPNEFGVVPRRKVKWKSVMKRVAAACQSATIRAR